MIMNIFNVLRKVDIVFKKGVTDIIFIGITISKIIILEGKTNFKGIFVKFMLTNMASEGGTDFI